jgi:hypothetical protein
MIVPTSFLPITVLSAITLFVTKECLEGVRRRQSNGRKRLAIRSLLASECERNHWAVKSLRGMMDGIRECPDDAALIKDPHGKFLAKIMRPSGQSTAPIPDVHKAYADKFMMEVALLDRRTFKRLMDAYFATLELEHIIPNPVGYDR